MSVAIDLDGRLVVADAGTKQLHLLDATTDEVIDLDSAPIAGISAVAGFKNGYLIADPTGNRVWRVDGIDQVTPFAGTGTAGGYAGRWRARPRMPRSPSRSTSPSTRRARCYILERGNRAVRVVDPDGTISTLPGAAAQPA